MGWLNTSLKSTGTRDELSITLHLQSEINFCLSGSLSMPDATSLLLGSPDIHRPNYTRTVVLCLILVHQFLTLLTELAPLSCIALLKPMGHLCDCVSLCVCKDFTSCLAT